MGIYVDPKDMCLRIKELPDQKYYDYDEAMAAWKKYKDDLAERRAKKKAAVRENPLVQIQAYMYPEFRDALIAYAKEQHHGLSTVIAAPLEEWMKMPAAKKEMIASPGFGDARRLRRGSSRAIHQKFMVRLDTYKVLATFAEDFNLTVSRVLMNILTAWMISNHLMDKE